LISYRLLYGSRFFFARTNLCIQYLRTLTLIFHAQARSKHSVTW